MEDTKVTKDNVEVTQETPHESKAADVSSIPEKEQKVKIEVEVKQPEDKKEAKKEEKEQIFTKKDIEALEAKYKKEIEKTKREAFIEKNTDKTIAKDTIEDLIALTELKIKENDKLKFEDEFIKLKDKYVSKRDKDTSLDGVTQVTIDNQKDEKKKRAEAFLSGYLNKKKK